VSNVMAILHDVDKCMRCNGCVIGCKRTWKMKALNPGVHKTAPDQRLIIKSQKRVDMGPFIRFSCWHCPDPPCVKRCPFKALTKQATGAVSIDPNLCQPGGTNAQGVTCTYQCNADCQRGGYPKVGAGSDLFAGPRSWKCTLCFGRAGADADLDAAYGNPLPSNSTAGEIAAVPEKAHWPTCVYTCPAKALTWDTRANILNLIQTGGYVSYQGDGSVFWASKKYILAAPKADPYVEDHLTPFLSGVLSDSVKRSALVPTLIAGGLLAVIARREQNARESAGIEKG